MTKLIIKSNQGIIILRQTMIVSWSNWLVLMRVDSCLTRVASCRTHLICVDSCWTRVDSCWLVLNSCWLVLIRVDLCWHSVLIRFDMFLHSCIRITQVSTQVNTSEHKFDTNQHKSNTSPTLVQHAKPGLLKVLILSMSFRHAF